MHSRHFLFLLLLGVASAWLPAQTPASAAAGKTIFESHCAACHGLDGRGGEAPNIATNPTVQGFSDARLNGIVHDGLPGGMPAFGAALSGSQIASVVDYLRELQRSASASAAAVPSGDAVRGQQLFFGSAGCSTCHMEQGRGGFIGSDLTGAPLSAAEIQAAIVDPAHAPADQWTTVRLRSGGTVTGVVRDETNFSIQLQDRRGAFHLLNKADVASISRSGGTIMPGDFKARLSASELNDLVAFVASHAGAPRRRRY